MNGLWEWMGTRTDDGIGGLVRKHQRAWGSGMR
mgnify:CR=1 FL=1